MCRKSLYTLLLALSLSLFGPTVQAETMYQISESELTQLEINLKQLKKNNETKQKLLTEQKKQLTIANQRLETVKEQLIESKSLNEATLKSLAKANQSLNEFEKEANHKIRVKARQRNLWILISGGLLYVLVNR